jgi:hypothetical protein
MKTIIFCTSYIDNFNYTRYKKWIDYYYNKLELFNASNLFLIDDGSSNVYFDHRVEIVKSNDLPGSLKSDINLFHFEDHLGRPSRKNYAGWWRSFTFSIKLAEKYNMDKIIHIESDYYIVSRRMIDYMAKTSEGWTVFYSKAYGFSETAIQIICKDSFEELNNTFKKAEESNYQFKKIAERVLPFSKIEKGFIGDRYGESKVLRRWVKKIKTPLGIDYLGQINEKDDWGEYKRFFKFDFDLW